MSIHPTAVIDKLAEIGRDCDIGPYVVIQGKVVVGDGTKLGPHAVILGNTTIGAGNNISGHVHIGGLPQDISYTGGESYVRIGDNNVIREFSNVHKGTKEGTSTVIGNNNFFMVGAHVAHNCRVGSNVILVNGVGLGGYVEVQDHAFVSAYVPVHQFSRIGCYSICGALAKITRDVPPFMMIDGNPALVRGLNLVGLKRKGFSSERREKIRKAYKILYRSGYSIAHCMEELEKLEPQNNVDIKTLIDFISSSKRGIIFKSLKTSSDSSEE